MKTIRSIQMYEFSKAQVLQCECREVLYIPLHVLRVQKNVIQQIDSKNGWSFLSTSFTAKFGLVFVLTLENDFSQRFHFKANGKNIGSSKKRYHGFSK